MAIGRTDEGDKINLIEKRLEIIMGARLRGNGCDRL